MHSVTVGERAQARGLGAPTRQLCLRGARGRRRLCASGESRAWGAERERSASTREMHLQIGKWCVRE
eukprot:1105770-Pleurochrysis_carterae.AAC.1